MTRMIVSSVITRSNLLSRFSLNHANGSIRFIHPYRSNICRPSVVALCSNGIPTSSKTDNNVPMFYMREFNIFPNVARNMSLSAHLLQKLKENPEASPSEAVDDSTEPKTVTPPSQKDRFKKVFKEYGTTVVVFHTCISLLSLGICYTAVSSGIDVVGILAKLGVGQSILESKLATGASTFVVAYAVHKVFVPARMACTITCTPLIVRYLRKIGFLKQAK